MSVVAFFVSCVCLPTASVLLAPMFFCHMLANDCRCAGTADRNGSPKIMFAWERPPARGVLRYSNPIRVLAGISRRLDLLSWLLLQ